MTRQETIDKVWTLLEILEAMPDSADIILAEVREFTGPDSFQIQLNSGIETLAKSLGLPISASMPENSEYIHRRIYSENCAYCQLDEKPSPALTAPERRKTSRENGLAGDNPAD